MVDPMKGLTLQRWCHGPHCTFGRIMLDPGIHIYTVERPWLDNRPVVSCIPVGMYVCQPREFKRGGYMAIEVTNVEDRSHILFHKANNASQLSGCIAPGMTLGVFRAEWSVLDSAGAFDLLMSEVGGQTWRLKIENVGEAP